jgi:hypothetical protein
MLASMMVSILILGTAFSTFWVATQSWEKARRRTEMLRLLEGVSAILTRQIQSVQPPFYQANPVFIAINDTDAEGDYDGIAFLSGANPRYPKVLETSDLCEIEIYVDAGAAAEDAPGGAPSTGADMSGAMEAGAATGTPRQNTGLWMRIDPTPDDDVESGGYLLSLAPEITSFNVQYYDGVEWLEEWYTDYEAPQAIEFTITATDPEGRENPMSLTRLVLVPNAERINNSSGSTMTSGQGTTSDQQSSGPGSGQSSSSGSGSTGSSGSGAPESSSGSSGRSSSGGGR